MTAGERNRFDRLLEQVLDAMPPHIHELLDETPLIVEDRPSRQLAAELGLDEDEDLLCGLHSGIPLTERSVEGGGELPEMIHMFREGVIDHAGGWERWRDDDGTWQGGPDAILREIRITLLHEIGHHYGLEEKDLEALGYE